MEPIEVTPGKSFVLLRSHYRSANLALRRAHVTQIEETPVETVVEEVVETAPIEVAETESQAEVVEENKAEIDADVSAAHKTSTHTTAEENATKPVDEVMEKTNEELERQ